MAFRELAEGLAKTLPRGATKRFAKLTALEKMLSGELYEHLPFSFETEKSTGRSYVPIRERRPSVDFNIAYEIVQDTLAELFGDEQFPSLQVLVDGEQLEDQTEQIGELIGPYGLDLPTIVSQAYEEGVVGAVGVVVHRGAEGLPYYDILPAKWCEPIYKPHSELLSGLVVTYPIDAAAAEVLAPGITTEQHNIGQTTFWYRFSVLAYVIVDFVPLSDSDYARLGETDETGNIIAFDERGRADHGFGETPPAVYVRNVGAKQRDTEGPALWWQIRNMCVEADYTLSQAGRGLRYAADPVLFLKRSGLDKYVDPIGSGADEAAEFAAASAAQRGDDGTMVRGAAQTIVGEDAKLLEISANGITEEREYVRDLREYALEVVGGQKARAEHLKGAPSGTSIDKGLKPLRRLVRRLRRPYGHGLLLKLVEITLRGFELDVFDAAAIDLTIPELPEGARVTLDWPNDETLKGQELFYHVEAIQLMAGGSLQDPVQLIAPEIAGARLAADVGFGDPYASIKGDLTVEDVRNPPPAAASPAGNPKT